MSGVPEDHFCIPVFVLSPVEVLTCGNVYLFREKIHFPLFLGFPDYDLCNVP